MRISTVLGSAVIAAAFSLSAQAADSMGSEAMKGETSPMMMQKGQTMVVMPDGTMGMMTTPDAMMTPDAMKMAKPMDHCAMMMMGADGKMMMMDDAKMCDDAHKMMMKPK